MQQSITHSEHINQNGNKQQFEQRNVHFSPIPRQFRSQNQTANQEDASACDTAWTWQAVQQVEVSEEEHNCPWPGHHHCVRVHHTKRDISTR